MARKTSEARRLERAEELVSTLWTPVWVCPSCGRPFAQLDQSHTCGPESVRSYLEGKSPHAIALYRRFAELVRRCGPVAIVPGRAGIAFHSPRHVRGNRSTDGQDALCSCGAEPQAPRPPLYQGRGTCTAPSDSLFPGADARRSRRGRGRLAGRGLPGRRPRRMTSEAPPRRPSRPGRFRCASPPGRFAEMR